MKRKFKKTHIALHSLYIGHTVHIQ